MELDKEQGKWDSETLAIPHLCLLLFSPALRLRELGLAGAASRSLEHTYSPRLQTCITFLEFPNTSGLEFIDHCLYLSLCKVLRIDYCCSLSCILHSCDRKQAWLRHLLHQHWRLELQQSLGKLSGNTKPSVIRQMPELRACHLPQESSPGTQDINGS